MMSRSSQEEDHIVKENKGTLCLSREQHHVPGSLKRQQPISLAEFHALKTVCTMIGNDGSLVLASFVDFSCQYLQMASKVEYTRASPRESIPSSILKGGYESMTLTAMGRQ